MKPTQIVVNRVPKDVYPSLKKAREEGKRLIREFKKQDTILGIDIQYVFV